MTRTSSVAVQTTAVTRNVFVRGNNSYARIAVLSVLSSNRFRILRKIL